MVQNIEFRMRNMPNIIIRNIEAVVQESIRKVTAWASHGGGEGEMGRVVHQSGCTIPLTQAT